MAAAGQCFPTSVPYLRHGGVCFWQGLTRPRRVSLAGWLRHGTNPGVAQCLAIAADLSELGLRCSDAMCRA